MAKKKTAKEADEQAYDDQFEDDDDDYADGSAKAEVPPPPVTLRHQPKVAVRSIMFLPGTDLVATCDAAGVTRIFDRRTGECTAERHPRRKAEYKAKIEVSGAKQVEPPSAKQVGPIGAKQVEPLGGSLVVTLMDDGSICMWDFRANEVLFEGEVAGCKHDETIVVLRGLGMRGSRTGEERGEGRWGSWEECFVGGTNFGGLVFLKHKRGKGLQVFKLDSCHNGAITSIAVWGFTMITGSEDKFALVWNWDTKKRLAVLGKDLGLHDCSVTGVDISAESIVTVAPRHDGHGAVRVFQNSQVAGFILTDEWKLGYGLGKGGVISLRGSALMAQVGNRLGFIELDGGQDIGDGLNDIGGEIRHADISRDGFVAICGRKTIVGPLSRKVKTEMTHNVDYRNPFILANALDSDAANERWESATVVSAKIVPVLKDESKKVLPNGSIPVPVPVPDPRHPRDLDPRRPAKVPRLVGNDDPRRGL